MAKAVRVYATTKCVRSESASKAMGEGEGLKLCVGGDLWNCESKGNIQPFGEKKNYVHFNVERVVSISFNIREKLLNFYVF